MRVSTGGVRLALLAGLASLAPAAAQQPVRLVPRDTFFTVPAAQPAPPPPPARWLGLVGEYGRGDTMVIVVERDGKLYALAPGAAPRLIQARAIRPDARGRGKTLVLGRAAFERRAVGPADGTQLRVTPVRPVSDLLREARGARPPDEHGELRRPDLVDLATLDSTIRFDIRYATTNNFLGTAFYATPHAFLQRPAAEALARAHRRLRARGYGLLIHDAYRPWYVTKVFWDATPPALHWLVADPAQGSRHNRGCAVDLTLYDLGTGQPVDMGGTYDEATERSFPDYPVGTTLQRWHRDLLREALEAEGYTRFAEEWWHFDFQNWRRYPILNRGFEDLGTEARVAPSAPHPARLWMLGGGHALGGALLYRETQASWGESNGRFHIKDDWSGDQLAQNDEISHFVTGYGLTKAFTRVWAWTGVSPKRARTLGAIETAVLLTLVEMPLDAFNPDQGFGVEDLVFDYAGIGVGLLALSRPGRWDFKFSAKKNLFSAQETLFAQDSRETDNYVFWLTYRPSLGWAERQPVSVGIGHSVRRAADGYSPVRELYLGLGTTVPDLVRAVAPGAARHFELLEAYFINVRVGTTVR
ncbi:MAG: M15 family metallopeptidase [Gemmatimonadales bacterium]